MSKTNTTYNNVTDSLGDLVVDLDQYCEDVKVVFNFYDTFNLTTRQLLTTSTLEVARDEYCGLAAQKEKQKRYSTVTYYAMMAAPFIVMFIPALITKFQVVNTLSIFLLFPFNLPLNFKSRFKLFSDLNTDDFLSKIIKEKMKIGEEEALTNLSNKEFNFQKIFGAKMLFQ